MQDQPCGALSAEISHRVWSELPVAGFHAMGICPCVKIVAAVNDLTAEAVEGWANALVAPLGKLVTVPDDVKFGVAKDVAAVLVKQI